MWVGPGANNDELLRFGEALKAKGLTPAATVLGNNDAANLLYAHRWTVVARAFIGDCPPFDPNPVISAAAWVDLALSNLSGVNFTWLSLTNECTWPSADYVTAWANAAITYAATKHITKIIPLVWNSGSPELEWMQTLAAIYYDKPIDVAFGINIYPVEDYPLSSHVGITAWTTYRYVQLRQWIPGVPIIVTEAARSDGTQAPDFNDIETFNNETVGDFEIITYWYDALPLAHWKDATLLGKLDQLAVAIRP